MYDISRQFHCTRLLNYICTVSFVIVGLEAATFPSTQTVSTSSVMLTVSKSRYFAANGEAWVRKMEFNPTINTAPNSDTIRLPAGILSVTSCTAELRLGTPSAHTTHRSIDLTYADSSPDQPN